MNTTRLSRVLAGAAVAGLVLTGCGGGTATSAGSSTAAATQGVQNDADVQFVQGMVPHHRQAVEMAALAAGRSQNPQVLDLAVRIGRAQEPEIATMTAWLQEWGVEGGRGGMDHGGMSGMMTPAQMQQLRQASGVAFDRMFLQMMTEHHRGAVEMAERELGEGADPAAKQLAQTIIDTQQGEIAEMEALLQQL
ncbi:MAG: DUF305 domain-containing protein [Pseudonocardia sp.]